ncbi:DUF1501 domain-containing protein [Bordetella sp. N]|uniref:DUF1501 domain-containing protein n=1 Tax=Bordetella sp. N TaxID=1746199 RepID=UPI00070CEFEB|nr:DUF1501 domain-containing protein [Bordetella sp. N]ALM86320.1 Tat pathway signal protein [Bordetella sp. N]
MTDATRREFLRRASLLGVSGSAAPLALQLAALGAAAAVAAPAQAAGGNPAAGAAPVNDYKALVCVFLYGGNDPYNTIVPYDPASHARYFQARADIALARDKLSATALKPRDALPGDQAFALAPGLAPLLPWFERGQLAVQLNVGPLSVPTSKRDYVGARVPLPPKLFSHNDQQSYWQALAPEGATSGWGGRLADLFLAANGNATFTGVTAGGSALLLAGHHVNAYRVSPAGSTPIELLQRDTYGSSTCTALLRQLITQSNEHLFERQHAATVARSISADARLRTALARTTVAGAFATPLAAQLKIVARMIAARDTLGMRRQVFFVTQNGYDNHDGLNDIHPGLLRELGGAMAEFQQALDGLGVARQVTTFTASEFGRTLVSNGNGSDHGWGGHHLVMGGAVRGGRFYGKHPELALDGPGFVDHGRMLPDVAVDQFGATLASWFGAGAASLNDVFPNLRRFDGHDLGFMEDPAKA